MQNLNQQQPKPLVNDIENKISTYVNENFKGIKRLKLRHTLAHELGHLEESLIQGFEFVLLRVGRFVYYIDGQGKRKQAILKGFGPFKYDGGVCYVIDGKNMSSSNLKQAYLQNVNAGPKATKTFVNKEITNANWIEKFFLNRFLRLNPEMLHGKSTCKEKVHFCIKRRFNSSKTNDQNLIHKLLSDTGDESAVQLNDRFKYVKATIHYKGLDIDDKTREMIKKL